MKSKSQAYSQAVFENIQKLIKEEPEDSKPVKQYKSLTKRAGGLLRSVGLIQFLTFLAAKATKPKEVHHGFLLNHLAHELEALKILAVKTPERLISQVQQQELPQYMRITQEVLKLIQWHRRISEILISGTVEGD
jgi:CRISPR type III-B/RAMP module-associated protein Cmr5